MPKSILLAGGGTAGHVNPLLAVATAVRQKYPDAVITVLGTREGLEADLVPSRGFDMRFVPRVPMPRRPTPQWFALPSKLQSAVTAAREAITEIDADVVIGFGGYVSTPAYLAARKLDVPIVVQEQNARAGIANKLGARWAKAVTTTFESTALPSSQVTGLPLRAEISALISALESNPEQTRRAAAAELGLDPNRPILLVTGGSLGALRLNRTITQVAPEILEGGVQILHLTGKEGAPEIRLAGLKNNTDVVIRLPGPEQSVVRETLNYQCDADQRISVEYINVGANSLAVVRIGEETVIASNVMAASGAKYAGGRYEWWTKGDEATLYDLTKGENAPGVNCRKTG